MTKKKLTNKLAIFEGNEIRRIAIDDEWYYSVVDVVKVLTDSENPRRYWSDLKIKIENEETHQLYEIIVQLKLKSSDSKKYLTDCADTEGLFRIIQSIPSKKAEPFKIWLAQLGKERLEEIEQPERAIQRGKSYYEIKGYSKQWIETRTAGIYTKHQFTDALQEKGVKDKEYAILTNEMYHSTFGMYANEYKKHKGLDKKESLRDNMTPLELASTIFSEATATEFLEYSDEKGFYSSRKYIIKAGNITKEAIEKIEKETGKKVITKENYKHLNLPERQKELVQKTFNKLEEKNLSDFNKNLKKGLDYNPKDD